MIQKGIARLQRWQKLTRNYGHRWTVTFSIVKKKHAACGSLPVESCYIHTNESCYLHYQAYKNGSLHKPKEDLLGMSPFLFFKLRHKAFKRCIPPQKSIWRTCGSRTLCSSCQFVVQTWSTGPDWVTMFIHFSVNQSCFLRGSSTAGSQVSFNDVMHWKNKTSVFISDSFMYLI